MKKVIISLCALAVLAGASSCKKDKEENVKVPVYAEGIYHPIMKIASVSQNGEIIQEWNWNGDNLESITTTGVGTTSFSYSEDYVTKVTSNGNLNEEIVYSYSDGQMTKCEVYYSGALAVTANIMHNEAKKMSGADIIIDDTFLMNLAGELLGKGSAFEQIVGRHAAESMILAAKMSQTSSASKFAITDKTFSMSLQWNGENVEKQILGGLVNFTLSSDDIAMFQQFIPEDILPLIQMMMMMTGGTIPVQVAVTDTITATFDNMYNPMFCNWGELISSKTLSLNNMLSSEENGAVTLSINVMGQNNELFSRPNYNSQEFSYEYNDMKYPTKVSSGTDEVIYTYKN